MAHHKESSETNWKLVGLKLATTLVVTAAIGFAIVTLKPGGGVTSADADIHDFSFFGPKPHHQRFIDSLLDEGMSPPRSYDWNGNKVFLSVGVSEDSPLTIFQNMQKRFADRDVNERAYMKPLAPDERIEAMMSGQIVPIVVSPRMVLMGGVELRDGVERPEAIAKQFFGQNDRFNQRVKRMRYIEVNRKPDSAKSTITASWSDDEFDLSKLIPGSDTRGASIDTKVPPCPGCERTRRFAGENSESDYVHYMYRGKLSVSQALDFYRKAFTGRDWRLSQSAQALESIDLPPSVRDSFDDMLSFTKNGKSLNVYASRDRRSGETVVHIFRSP